MDALTVENKNIALSHREEKLTSVWPLYQAREPAYVMFLLRRNRRKLDQALRATGVMDTESLCALTKAVCALAETSARYAQVPTAPKPRLLGNGDEAKPVFDLAAVSDA